MNRHECGPGTVKSYQGARYRSAEGTICRTTRYFVLGMSLSALLDIPSAVDYLKALLALLQEFDAVPDDRFERRNVSKLSATQLCRYLLRP